jgi:tetratricopeptide (TPR) repeat protein
MVLLECRYKGKEWLPWGERIYHVFMPMFHEAKYQDEKISITLYKDEWLKIKSIVQANRKKRGKSGIQWADSVIREIQERIEKAKNIPNDGEMSKKQDITKTSIPVEINISSDGIKYFNRAMDISNESAELDESKKSEILEYLALAIDKANSPFPHAEAYLGLFLYLWDQTEKALFHANRALLFDPDEFIGQDVRVLCMFEKMNIQENKRYEGLDKIDSIEAPPEHKAIASLVGLLGVVGLGASDRRALKMEIMKLIENYRKACKIDDIEGYIWNSIKLMHVGDLIKDIPFPGGRIDLFTEVVNAPISHLEMDGHDTEVEELRLKAERKSAALKI